MYPQTVRKYEKRVLISALTLEIPLSKNIKLNRL